METNIVVSVIMTSYNHEKYIRHAIESVLAQKTDFKYEILIYDDASTDNSQKIILEYAEKYPDKFKLFLQEENQLSKGIQCGNIVLPYLSGEYIACCECDDFWIDEYKLQKQVDFLNNHPEIIQIGHNSLLVDEEGNKLEGYLADSNAIYTRNKEGVWTMEHLWKVGLCGHTASKMIRNVYKNNEDIQKLFMDIISLNADVYETMILGCMGDMYMSETVVSACRKSLTNGSYTARTHNANMSANAARVSVDIMRVSNFFKNKYAKQYAVAMAHEALRTAYVEQRKNPSEQNKEILKQVKEIVPFWDVYRCKMFLKDIYRRRILKKV